MIKVSVAIPVYGMHGKGVEFIKKNLDSLAVQTLKEFEVVISDNSDDNDIENAVKEYKGLNIYYFKNPKKGMASNTNEAMIKCRGEVIKILYQDDMLSNEDSLEVIYKSFNTETMWVATSCKSENGIHHPYYTGDIIIGNNKIGSPSVVAIRNKDVILFDEKMTWVLDCDYYRRMYDLHGEPKYVFNTCTTLGLGRHQTTHMLSDLLKQEEVKYMQSKYA